MKNIATRFQGAPAAVLALGVGFVMAAGADLQTAVVMGITVLLTLVLSALVMALLGKVVPSYAKLPVYLLVTTGFVSIANMLLQAYFPDAADQLGVHVAALAVSLVSFRGAQEEKVSVADAVLTGALFVVLMALCALIREVLGSASLWGTPIAALGNYKISALAGTFGGFLVLSVVLAIFNKVTGLNAEEKEEN